MSRSRRRGQYDPLQTVDRVMWLVVTDRCSAAIRTSELAPRTDLKATLAAERERMIADGWGG
jgi:hypothetical protein